MVVAMAGVHMVQPAVDQIIEVIPVRHGLVPAARPVHMPATVQRHGAAIRVCIADRDHMLVHMVAVHMVQMAVVQIVHMALMKDSGMAAVAAMG